MTIEGPFTEPALVRVADGYAAEDVAGRLAALGLRTRAVVDGEGTTLIIAADSARCAREEIAAVEGVARVGLAASEHPLVDAAAPIVRVPGAGAIGAGAGFMWLAGPCAAESRAQVAETVERLAPLGVGFLRGGAFKPRTSPYSFAGEGERALDWLREAADAHGLGVVTEAVTESQVDAVAERADLLQVGSRNMYNAGLLERVARAGKPVLLKRALSGTVRELLLAAERLLLSGAPGVVLCERGVRGFEPSTRNLLDIGAVAQLAHVHQLPIVIDPSHAAGRRDLVAPLVKAAAAAGAHGALVEVHHDPARARSDAAQALLPEELEALIRDLRVTTLAAREDPGRGQAPPASRL
jgi:3-deoxy-7-phosphoheptulonate synthase